MGACRLPGNLEDEGVRRVSPLDMAAAAIALPLLVGPAKQAEEIFHASCLTPATGATIRKLAALAPKTLALMHGSSYDGDAPRALSQLAELYDGWLRSSNAA